MIDQCQQAVVLGAAGGAHGQVQGDTGEPGAGVVSAELGLDVLVEHRPCRPAASVSVIDLEDRFGEAADAAIGR